MSLKPVFLLLFFLLNVAVTVVADSSHIEMGTHTASVEHSGAHHDHDTAPSSQAEHCPEHDQCHTGHYHHYLVTEFAPSIGCTQSAKLVFIRPQSFYTSSPLDIIKPPSVLS